MSGSPFHEFLAYWPGVDAVLTEIVWRRVLGAFASRVPRTSFSRWAHTQPEAYTLANVRKAFFGEWRGPQARACVERALRDAGVMREAQRPPSTSEIDPETGSG